MTPKELIGLTVAGLIALFDVPNPVMKELTERSTDPHVQTVHDIWHTLSPTTTEQIVEMVRHNEREIAQECAEAGLALDEDNLSLLELLN